MVVGQRDGAVTGGKVVLIALAAEEKIDRILEMSLAIADRASLPICSMIGRIGAIVTPGKMTSGRLAVTGGMITVLLGSRIDTAGSDTESAIDAVLMEIGVGSPGTITSVETDVCVSKSM